MQTSAATKVRKVKKPVETLKRPSTFEICSSMTMTPMAMAQTMNSLPARRLGGVSGEACSGISGLCIPALYGNFAPRFLLGPQRRLGEMIALAVRGQRRHVYLELAEVQRVRR